MKQRGKQLLSLLLSMLLVFSLLPTYAAAGDVATIVSDTTWYNTTDTSFTLITPGQLLGLAELVNGGNTFKNKTIYLANDIDLSNVAWTPIGTFSGTFDGQGCTISGLNVTAAKAINPYGRTGDYAGFFGYCEDATIRNLTVSGSVTVTLSDNSAYIGGLVGEAYGGSILNCGAQVAVTVSGSVANNKEVCVGGLVGELVYATLKNSYHNGSVSSTATITVAGTGTAGTLDVGGVAGQEYGDSKCENCYHAGTISSGSYGVVGAFGHDCGCTTYLRNCYYASGTASAASNPSESKTVEGIGDSAYLVIENNAAFTDSNTLLSNLNANRGEGRFWQIKSGVNDGYPVFAAYWTDAGNYDTTWYTQSTTTFTINMPAQLAGLAYLVNTGENLFEGKTVNLSADIDLSAYLWEPIGWDEDDFQGIFDGQGHTVSGMSVKNDLYFYAGLFGYCTDATIKNLTVAGSVDINVPSGRSSYVGGLVGEASGGSILNCGAQVTINVSGTASVDHEIGVGGLVGELHDSTLKNSYHNGKINSIATTVAATDPANDKNGVVYVGGVVGQEFAGYPAKNSYCVNCYHADTLTAGAATSIGGLVGYFSSTSSAINYLQNCYYPKDMSASGGNNYPSGGSSGAEITEPTLTGNLPFDAETKLVQVDSTTTPLVDKLNDGLDTGYAAWTVKPGVNGGYPVFADYWTDTGNYNAEWYKAGTTSYTISTPRDLAALAAYCNSTASPQALNITLGADIDLTGHLWAPIGNFSGTFDGAGHKVSGMSVVETYYYAGLFGMLGSDDESVTVRNLGVEDSSVRASFSSAGGVCGSLYASGYPTILINCYSTAEVSDPLNNSVLLGRIISPGEVETVSNCYAVNGTNVGSGEYWDGTKDKSSNISVSTSKTADQLKALTPTLNDWVTAKGTGYSNWYTSSQYNSGFPCFQAYVPPYVPSYYTISAAAGENGTITPSGDRSVIEYSAQTYTITPASGYQVSNVLVDGVSVGAVTSYTFKTVSKSHTISASFSRIPITYPDVGDDDWFKPDVDYVTDKGLMDGIDGGLVDPYGSTNRAMIVTVLWRMDGRPASNYAYSFQDVPEGVYYTEAVRWAAEHGIVNGYDAEKFGPADLITREQLAVMLYRYAVYKGTDVTAAGDLTTFTDSGSIDTWAEAAMTWAVGAKIFQGSGALLRPTANAQRAEVAAVFHRFAAK